MKNSIFAVIVLAVASFTSTVNAADGTVRFYGSIVEEAHYDINKQAPANPEAKATSTKESVFKDGEKIGEIVTITWQ
jgi:type 1 fimbria pilin